MEYDEDGLPVIQRQGEPEVESRELGAVFRPSQAQAAFLSTPLDIQSVPVGMGAPASRAGLTVTEMARLGGHARWAKLSPARRSEIAQAAARARWEKSRG